MFLVAFDRGVYVRFSPGLEFEPSSFPFGYPVIQVSPSHRVYRC